MNPNSDNIHYDPLLGQFISVDPLYAKYPGISAYVYCMNNPVEYWDPTGEDWFSSKSDGSMIYLAGESEMDEEFLELVNSSNGTEYEIGDFDNIGGDDMFDTDELNISEGLNKEGFDNLYLTPDGAEQFMTKMGYEKTLHRETTTTTYTTEDYEPCGKIETSTTRTDIKERISYMKPYTNGQSPDIRYASKELPEIRSFAYGVQENKFRGPYRPTLMLRVEKNTKYEILPANKNANSSTKAKVQPDWIGTVTRTLKEFL